MLAEEKEAVAFIVLKSTKDELAKWAAEKETGISTIVRQIVAEALEKRAAKKSKQK